MIINTFMFLNAAVSYRMFPFGHTINKIIHAVCHTLSLCFVVTGITCMVLSKNYVKYSNTDDYVNNTATVELTPNLYTLHSFIGIGALCLWFQVVYIELDNHSLFCIPERNILVSSKQNEFII